MKTYLDCIPCFFRQTIEACRMIGLSDGAVKRILDEVARHIPEIELEDSPPVMGSIIHRIIREETNNPDPYKHIKKKSNDLVLSLYPLLKKKVENSQDRILEAVEIAIAGNIIDYGALFRLDLHAEIDAIINMEDAGIKNEDPRFFAYRDFIASLERAKTILYCADNAGEIVCDRILIEEIHAAFPATRIVCAVRGGPIINDCLVSDAVEAGIDKTARVIANGVDAPGTLLGACSKEFLDAWRVSDMIISKGQGNFESLAGNEGNIFFMFIVKCGVLAADIGCRIRDVILYHG
ncbi:MAG: DUF89 family protein [Spirochaetales bacterium]|nr:DUF89 family protein [Spirochaetales bacterium]